MAPIVAESVLVAKEREERMSDGKLDIQAEVDFRNKNECVLVDFTPCERIAHALRFNHSIRLDEEFRIQTQRCWCENGPNPQIRLSLLLGDFPVFQTALAVVVGQEEADRLSQWYLTRIIPRIREEVRW